MSWSLKNVGWPIPYQTTSWPISTTKHKIESTPILNPYKIVAIPLYNNYRFYYNVIKGTNVDTWA